MENGSSVILVTKMITSTIKPRLTFWQLWNISFGFFGIQFGFALQNANTSRIFSTLGASADDLPLYWLAAPVTGLLVQPVIGYLSDHTWHPFWGRRRPFFFIGAILVYNGVSALAAFLLPVFAKATSRKLVHLICLIIDLFNNRRRFV